MRKSKSEADNTVEGWSNFQTWFVNLQAKNNRECNDKLAQLRGKWTVPIARIWVRTWISKFPRDFEGLHGMGKINWEELVEDWNAE